MHSRHRHLKKICIFIFIFFLFLSELFKISNISERRRENKHTQSTVSNEFIPFYMLFYQMDGGLFGIIWCLLRNHALLGESILCVCVCLKQAFDLISKYGKLLWFDGFSVSFRHIRMFFMKMCGAKSMSGIWFDWDEKKCFGFLNSVLKLSFHLVICCFL